MSADMFTSFKVQDGRIVLDRIDLTTDGAESELTGVVDTARWPEMFYQVKSKVQFPRMREIFFARDTFSLHGEGDFTGTFHLFKGGRELKGNFFSREAGINDYRFRNLEGALEWVPDRFEVMHASSEFLWGPHALQTPDGASGPAGPEGSRTIQRRVREHRSAVAHRVLRVARHPARRARDRPESARVAAGGVSRAHRQRHDPVAPPASPHSHGPRADRGAHRGGGGARTDDWGPFSNHLPLAPVSVSGALDYSFDGRGVRLSAGELSNG